MADRSGFRDHERWRGGRDWDENRDRGFSGGHGSRPNREYGRNRDFGWQNRGRDFDRDRDSRDRGDDRDDD